MPVQVSYPGVYIQEVPSQVRAITGVATSITAFVGTATSGPVGVATLIHSQADYDRTFGGLAVDSPMSFAVRDFFLNGGSTGVIVRLYHPDTVKTSTSAISVIDSKHTKTLFTLVAASPGSWGVGLRVTLDNNTSADVAAMLGGGIGKADLFNLTVTNVASGAAEMHRNITFLDSARRIDTVLANNSQLVNWPPAVATVYVKVTAKAPSTPAFNTNIKAAFTGGTTALFDAIQWDLLNASDPAADLVGDTGKAAAPQSQLLVWNQDFFPTGKSPKDKVGVYALEDADLFNILVIPPYDNSVNPLYTDGDVQPDVLMPALAYCIQRRAILLVDPPTAWQTKNDTLDPAKSSTNLAGWTGSMDSDSKKSAAIFFPRLIYNNPFHSNQPEPFAPSGALAGIFARTDTQRGVWKAPAGLDAGVGGATALAYNLTDLENGDLNTVGLNCLRTMPAAGRVVWGSRTLQGDDRLASQWKYISVRRTALFLEESIFRGTQWVVFEPNDEPLWAQIRLNIGAFMHQLFLQGAFQGRTPTDAYFVKCDNETTTQNDINNGIVNLIVGFAPLKPAEFVIVSLQQMAGQVQV